MNVSATLQRIDEIAQKITALGYECAQRTIDVDWECPQGRRAEKKAEEVAAQASKLGEIIAAANLQVRTFLA